MDTPLLIVLSGLPGVGKTSVARAMAARRQIAHVRIDSIEAGLATSRLKIARAEDAGHLAARGVVADNLLPGRWALVDAVNEDAWCRDGWALLAESTGARLLAVELLCGDPAEHRARIETRREAQGASGPTWAEVRARHWEPWHRPRLLIDTGHHTPEDAAAEILTAADMVGA